MSLCLSPGCLYVSALDVSVFQTWVSLCFSPGYLYVSALDVSVFQNWRSLSRASSARSVNGVRSNDPKLIGSTTDLGDEASDHSPKRKGKRGGHTE